MGQFVLSSAGKAFRKTNLGLKCETEVFQAGLQRHTVTQIHFGGLFFRLFSVKSMYIAIAIHVGREFSVQIRRPL